jgi:hypothetical protein
VRSDPTSDAHADKGDLLFTDPYARRALLSPSHNAKVRQRGLKYLLQTAHVLLWPTPTAKVEDRISNKLARTMIGNLTAAIHIVHLNTKPTKRRDIKQHVGSFAAPPESVYMGMLEKNEYTA